MNLSNNQFGFEPIEKENEFGFVPQTEYEKGKKLIEESEEPDLEIERHIGRLTSRGIEQVLGAPGNIRELGKGVKGLVQSDINNDPFRKFLEKKGMSLKEPESNLSKAIKPIEDFIGNYINKIPTSSQLKDISENVTKGYTKPQGKAEELGDEIFENVVSFSLPGQGQYNLVRNVLNPLAGVLGKEAIKKLGGSEKSQFIGQTLTNLLLPLMIGKGRGNAPQYNKDLWQNLERNIPNAAVSAVPERARAMNLVNHLKTNTLLSAGENEVLSKLETFLENTKSGNLSAQQLVSMNRSLNEIRKDPKLLEGSRTLLNDVSDMIKSAGKRFERTQPQFYKDWKTANETHGAIADSNFIGKVVQKHSEPLMSEGARSLFGAAVHGTGKAAALIPPLYALYKGTQVFVRMAKSPTLMKYYGNVLSNAARGNVAAMSSNLDKLDKALLEQEKSSKPPFKNQTQKK